MEKHSLIFIGGTTASGKSDTAVELALRVGGEVVSCDSAQVYRHMDIGTAKITKEEMKGVPHHMIDVADPWDAMSAARYKEMAIPVIEGIYERCNIPVMVGGTPFYAQGVLYDIDFGTQGNAEPTELDSADPEALYEKLCEVDPEAAKAIHRNNKKRVLRALEFYYETGQKISDHNREQRERSSPYDLTYFAIVPERELIYERTDRRVDLMIDMGLEEEVRRLLDMGCTPDMVSMQAIGYRQMIAYILGKESGSGKPTLEETAEEIKTATRHFAKRQITWLNREKEAVRVRSGEEILERYK